MQALCQWEVQPDTGAEHLRDFLSEQELSSGSSRLAEQLVTVYWLRAPRIDKLIADAAEHWDFSRISPVERNIMRVAVVELLEGITPPKAAISEALEIGREFGGADSPRFLNGVLDRVWRSVESAAATETS